MSITREQVKELQPGDVVELRNERWPEGTVIRGPLHLNEGRLECGPAVARWSNGDQQSAYDLTVVSRAPRPLYVNHPRTEPVPGDVVRQESGPDRVRAHTWHYLGDGDNAPRWWRFDDTRIPFDRAARLRLLIDGETGQVVP